MLRHSAAVLLGGGWILLFNPHPDRPLLNLAGWDRIDFYESSYLCEQARREEMAEFMAEEHETAFRTESRYRCERQERVRDAKTRGQWTPEDRAKAQK
jgi:hypothetical protein